MTIVFVNLVFKDQDKAEVIGSAIQDACVHISSVLRAFRGQINKVFMFDKVGVSGGAGPSAGERGRRFYPESAVSVLTRTQPVRRRALPAGAPVAPRPPGPGGQVSGAASPRSLFLIIRNRRVYASGAPSSFTGWGGEGGQRGERGRGWGGPSSFGVFCLVLFASGCF